jgi:hypothetical protein
MHAAYKTSERCRKLGAAHDSLVGICVIVGGVALLVGSMFGSFLPNEWCYWLGAYLVRYAEIYDPGVEATAAVSRSDESAPAA